MNLFFFRDSGLLFDDLGLQVPRLETSGKCIPSVVTTEDKTLVDLSPILTFAGLCAVPKPSTLLPPSWLSQLRVSSRGGVHPTMDRKLLRSFLPSSKMTAVPSL